MIERAYVKGGYAMNTSVCSQVRSLSSLLSRSSADGSAGTLDEFSPMWGGAGCADVAWVMLSSSRGDDGKGSHARTPKPPVAEPAVSLDSFWNALRLFLVTETFQTFVRAIDEDEGKSSRR